MLREYDRANAPQCFGSVCVHWNMTERTRHSVSAVCSFTGICQSERATVFRLCVRSLEYSYEPEHRVMNSFFYIFYINHPVLLTVTHKALNIVF